MGVRFYIFFRRDTEKSQGIRFLLSLIYYYHPLHHISK